MYTTASLTALAGLIHKPAPGGVAPMGSLCDFDTPYQCSPDQRAALHGVSQADFAGPSVACVHPGGGCSTLPLGACQAKGGYPSPSGCCPGSTCAKPEVPGFASAGCSNKGLASLLLDFSESAKLARKVNSVVVGQLDFTQADFVNQSVPAQYVPSSVPAQYVPSSVPAQYVPSSVPAQYVPSSVPAQYVPSSVPGEYVPSSVPVQYVPSSYPAQYVPSSVMAQYVPSSVPGQFVPSSPSIPANFVPTSASGQVPAGLAGIGSPTISMPLTNPQAPTVYSPIVFTNNSGNVRFMTGARATQGMANPHSSGHLVPHSGSSGSAGSASLHPLPGPNPPAPNPTVCPLGMVYSAVTKHCEVLPEPHPPAPNPTVCPLGMVYSALTKHCEVLPAPPAPNPTVCPSGMVYSALTKHCVPLLGPHGTQTCRIGETYDAMRGMCVPFGAPSSGSSSSGTTVTVPIGAFKVENRTNFRIGSMVVTTAHGTASLSKPIGPGKTAKLSQTSKVLFADTLHVTVDGAVMLGGQASAAYVVDLSQLAQGATVTVNPMLAQGDLVLGPLFVSRSGTTLTLAVNLLPQS